MLCFVPILNYTTLKLLCVARGYGQGFVPILNYTTLKRRTRRCTARSGFVPILNYTTLKHRDHQVIGETCFVPILNYTTLKPQNLRNKSIRTHTVQVIGIGISNLYQKMIVFNIFRINHCRLYSVFRIHDSFQ